MNMNRIDARAAVLEQTDRNHFQWIVGICVGFVWLSSSAKVTISNVNPLLSLSLALSLSLFFSVSVG